MKAVFAVLTREVSAGLPSPSMATSASRSGPGFRRIWRMPAQPCCGISVCRATAGRAVALDPTRADLNAWSDRPPIIIDESDAECADLRRALDLGYAGTSHKNCKGVFKGVAHACLISQRTAQRGGRLIMSGEDLCSIGPVSMLQDLAVQAVLGVASVERNGHHYFAGLSPWPREFRMPCWHIIPISTRHRSGWPRLSVRDGRLSTRSVVRAPLGVGVELPFERIVGRRITA